MSGLNGPDCVLCAEGSASQGPDLRARECVLIAQERAALINAVVYNSGRANPLSFRSNAMQAWENFFRCQNKPMLRSQILTAIMSGTVLEVDRIPTSCLLDVVLLSTAAREYCDAEIVSDYQELLQRTRDEWSVPDWSSKVFDNLYGSKANFILQGSTNFDGQEVAFIPEMTAWYLAQEVPTFFDTPASLPAKAVKGKRPVSSAKRKAVQ